MHLKRCAVEPDTDSRGNPIVHRRVTADMRRYMVAENALVTFGNLSRDIRANVVIEGCDVDGVGADLARGMTAVATMVIDDGGEADLPVIYRLTGHEADPRPLRNARRAA